MTWEILLVHGNEDVMEVTASSREEAVEWVEREEARRGCSTDQLRKDFILDIPRRIQWGTNYHYANMAEEVQDDRP